MKIDLKIPEKIFGLESALITTFLPTLALVVLIIISANVLILPKITDYKDMISTRDQLKQQEKALAEKVNYLRSIDPEELKKNSDFITSALLPEKNAYMLVEMIRKIADKYLFQIDSFSINPGKLSGSGEGEKQISTNTPMTIPIELVLVGPASKYLELIKGMENSLPILSLKKFDMKNQQEMAKLEIEVSAYYLQEKTNYDISKISLADLTMKKEETDLLTRLGGFQILGNVSEIEQSMGLKREFKKYDRLDPFSL